MSRQAVAGLLSAVVRRRFRQCAGSLLFLAAPPSLVAQPVIGVDATVATTYVFRGAVRSSNFVVQPAAWLAYAAGSGFVTAGAWFNIEPRRAGPFDITLVEQGERGVGETNLWIEFAARSSGFDWKIGAVRYDYSRTASIGVGEPFLSTHEVYAGITLPTRPLQIALTGWADIDAIDGRYYELEVNYPFRLLPLQEILNSIFLGATLGVSDGQELGGGGAGSAYFVRDGVTHAALHASITIGPVVRGAPRVHLAGQYQFGRDEATQRASADPSVPDRARHGWFEFALSWSVPPLVKR